VVASRARSRRVGREASVAAVAGLL